MSRNILIAVFVLAGLLVYAQSEQPAERQLSELSKLKMENFQLKVQLLQVQITNEQAALSQQFAKELDCTKGFNWSTAGCNP